MAGNTWASIHSRVPISLSTALSLYLRVSLWSDVKLSFAFLTLHRSTHGSVYGSPTAVSTVALRSSPNHNPSYPPPSPHLPISSEYSMNSLKMTHTTTLRPPHRRPSGGGRVATATIGRADNERPYPAHERDVLPSQGHRGSQGSEEGRQGLRVQHDPRVPHVHHRVRVSGGAVAPARATPNATAAAAAANAANTAIRTSTEAVVSAGNGTISNAMNSGGVAGGVRARVRVSGVSWRRIGRKRVTAMGLPSSQGSGKVTAWVNMYLSSSCSVWGGGGVSGAGRAALRKPRQSHAVAKLMFAPTVECTGLLVRSLLFSSGWINSRATNEATPTIYSKNYANRHLLARLPPYPSRLATPPPPPMPPFLVTPLPPPPSPPIREKNSSPWGSEILPSVIQESTRRR